MSNIRDEHAIISQHEVIVTTMMRSLKTVVVWATSTSAALLQLSAMPDRRAPRLLQYLASPGRQYAHQELVTIPQRCCMGRDPQSHGRADRSLVFACVARAEHQCPAIFDKLSRSGQILKTKPQYNLYSRLPFCSTFGADLGKSATIGLFKFGLRPYVRID